MEESENNKINKKPESDLFARSVKGGFWVFAIRVAAQLLSVVRYILLFNILALNDMGILGVALLMVATLDTFTRTGFNAALIQKKGDITDDLNTAWTIGLIRAVILFGVLYFTAPYFSKLNVPADKIATTLAVIRVMGLSFIIGGFNNIGVVYFDKEMRFDRHFIIQVAGTLTSIAVSVFIVLVYRSVWSLVIGRLSAAVVRCALSYALHPFRPKLHFDSQRAKHLWAFGKWVFAATIIGFFITQGDDYFVWGYLGLPALALYQAAYKFSNIPATEITHVISQVSFPAYSKLQDDIPRFSAAYLKILKMTACLSIPTAGLIFILTPEFVTIFMEPRLWPMIPAMQILAICGLLRSIGATTGSVFLAAGRPDITPKVALSMLILLAIIIFPLTRKWGIAGTSMAILTITLCVQPIAQYFIIKLLRCSIWNLAQTVIVPFTAAGVAVAAVYITKSQYLITTVPSFLLIGLEGAVIYTAVLLAVDKIFGCDIINIAKEQVAVLKSK